MNATGTSKPPHTLTVVICTTFPVLLLLCICCIICITAERRKPLPRATVIVPLAIEARVVDIKEVPPLPNI
jgi:hypothetical protein